MSSALLIRLRPAGPWRFGPADGARDRVDTLYRSDRLYSAVCHALADLGLLDEWLEASARAAQPAAVFSSLFPFQGDTLFAPPPETIWPPAASSLRSPSHVFLNRVRWRAVKFVPLPVIDALLTGAQIQADQWIADADCGCLLRRDRPQSSPFRLAVRSRAAVDRVTGASSEAHRLACVEFEPGAGLWGVVVFSGKESAGRWRRPLEAALRLLGDSGFGGQRTAGWGQAPDPEIVAGDWPGLLLPKLARATAAGNGALSPLHWLLSLYSPAGTDDVNWSEGKYQLVLRTGRVESRAAASAAKKPVRMVGEGSVLSAHTIVGRAVDVAPDGFPHPVYRAGFALALQLPVIHVVETPLTAAQEEVSESSAILAEALASAEEEAARQRTEEPPVEPVSRAEAETPQAGRAEEEEPRAADEAAPEAAAAAAEAAPEVPAAEAEAPTPAADLALETHAENAPAPVEEPTAAETVETAAEQESPAAEAPVEVAKEEAKPAEVDAETAVEEPAAEIPTSPESAAKREDAEHEV